MNTEKKHVIKEILEKFMPVSLRDIEKHKLINRFDTKYLFNYKYLFDILNHLKDNYLILEINDMRIFDYENLYFDTKDYSLYKLHHNGKLNRFKVRLRRYIDTDTCYFEIKYKSNKAKTSKDRILKSGMDKQINGLEKKLLLKNTDVNPDDLLPKLTTMYKRITLLNKKISEKITFDVNIAFKNGKATAELPELVIAEVKSNCRLEKTEFYEYTLKKRIHPFRLSKYCTGTILTNPDIKHNRFKQKLIFINKLQNGTNGTQ